MIRTKWALRASLLLVMGIAASGCSDKKSNFGPAAVAASTASAVNTQSTPTATPTSTTTPGSTTTTPGSTTPGSTTPTTPPTPPTPPTTPTTPPTPPTPTTPPTPLVAPTPTPETDPPLVVLTSPTRGQFMTVQQTLVEGTITDASGLAYFLINGTIVTPSPNGNFSHPVALQDGLNIIEILAADPWANQTRMALPVVSGQFLPETSVVTDALAVRLNRPAFDAIEQIAAQQLGGTNLGQMIMSQNPLVQSGGSLASINVSATSATFGTPLLDLDPQVGGLMVRVELPNIDLTVVASGRVIGIPYSVTTQVTATNAVVDAVAVVSISQGVVTTDLQNVVIDLQGFRFDINNVPGFLEQLARNAVRRLIEDQIKKQVEDTIPDEINKAIAGANGPITQTVLGQQVTLHLIPTAVVFDADGASVLTDGDMVMTTPAGLTLPTTPGSFTTAGAAPTHGQAKAIYLSANDDLLNRIGHATWRGGMMNMTIDQTQISALRLPPWLQLDAFLLTVFFPNLAGQLNPGDPIELEISSATPAIFQTRAAPGLLEAGIGDLTVSIYVAPAGQPRQLVLKVGTQIKAEVGISVANNTLQVGVVGRPTISSDVFETPIAPLNEVAVENLMDFVLPPVISVFANSWSGFPLPTYPGINPANLDVHQDGPALDFVTIEGDL